MSLIAWAIWVEHTLSDSDQDSDGHLLAAHPATRELVLSPGLHAQGEEATAIRKSFVTSR